jgi:uncharacterized protein (TIGR03437 family)
MKIHTTLPALLFLGTCAWQAFAQPAFDSSGDAKLNGAYYFRQVLYVETDAAGDVGEAMNVQGTITFNGTGGYTVTNASLVDEISGSTAPSLFTNTSGTYVVSASGQGYISAVHPYFPNDRIIGLVSQNGVFIGSSTETSFGYNDLFIAAPVGSANATNATLNGSYTVAYFDPTAPGDAVFNMTANGAGNIGAVNVNSSVQSNQSTESLTGVTYSFTNGGGEINFGGTRGGADLIGGTETVFISPDGKFIFGGSTNGFDMFAGVLATTTPTNYNGLYYQAGLDFSYQPGSGQLDSYFGSFHASSQMIIGHQRVNSLLQYGGSSDFTYYDTLAVSANPDGTVLSDSLLAENYAISSDGTIRVGYGLGPAFGINIAFLAPTFSGSGVYLSPVGVVNGASSAPFTAFLSPGEILTLYGSGLAPTANSASVPFPSVLSGVQVMINGVAAPIFYVSPTQVSVIVPYATSPGSIAQVEVINNGVESNVVTQFTGQTSIGVFTNNPSGGLGYAAAVRPDGSIISNSNPAQTGETEAVFVAGMGAVSNQPVDGTAAPGSPLSNTIEVPQVYLLDSAGNFAPATVVFSGLAPGLAGLYQINFTVPSGLVTSNSCPSSCGAIEIYSGLDSNTLEALLPLSGSTASSRPSEKARPRDLHHRFIVH